MPKNREKIENARLGRLVAKHKDIICFGGSLNFEQTLNLIK